MEKWNEYKLGDVLTIKYGKDHKQIADGDVPIYGSGGIIRYGERSLYDGPSILIPRKGSLNNIMFADKPFWTVDTMFWTIINEDIANPLFIYYSICKKDFASLNVGSAVPSLTVPVIEDIDISLPSRDTQDKVVAVLKSLDDKIEVNRQINDNLLLSLFQNICYRISELERINDNLEQQAQALYKSWFVDFEPFKDGEFVESELGLIPEGWRVVTLDELSSFISRGLTPKYNESTEELVLGQTCVRNNIVSLNNARKHLPKTKNEKWVKQWDILINSTGIGSLGRVGVVYFNKDNVAIDSHITVVRAGTPLLRHYVARNLLSRQLEIENMAVGSTGQTELPRERVKAMSIILPDDNTLSKFNGLIEPLALSMYRSLEENQRLAELRDSILPRLMSGELNIDNVTIN